MFVTDNSYSLVGDLIIESEKSLCLPNTRLNSGSLSDLCFQSYFSSRLLLK